MIYGSIDGMLRTLDPHSSLLRSASSSPRCASAKRGTTTASASRSSPSIEGDVTVTQLFEGSPAYQAGIRRGDVIAMVEKREHEGLDDR